MTRRTPEQLRKHFEVERELAERLRNATRDERRQLYPSLYDELFDRVPDHPRLTMQETDEQIQKAVRARMRLLEGELEGVTDFLEIAPGDCRLSFEVCKHVPHVRAADISDQTRNVATVPDNFEMMVYDGFELPVEPASVDLAFSYQFIEHLHPDDVEAHIEAIHRALRPGGKYILDTPHRFSGPHDVSVHFSNVPLGFHLKEWTFGEMIGLLRNHGFRTFYCFRRGRPRKSGLITTLTIFGEYLLLPLPHNLRRFFARRLYQSVAMIAIK